MNTNNGCKRSPPGNHWWMIEEPNGEFSHARCKYCSSKTVFYNSAKHVSHDVTKQVRLTPHEEYFYDTTIRNKEL